MATKHILRRNLAKVGSLSVFNSLLRQVNHKLHNLTKAQKLIAKRSLLLLVVATSAILLFKLSTTIAAPPGIEEFNVYNSAGVANDFGDAVLVDASGNSTYISSYNDRVRLAQYDKSGNQVFAQTTEALNTGNGAAPNTFYPSYDDVVTGQVANDSTVNASYTLSSDDHNNQLVAFVSFYSSTEYMTSMTARDENFNSYTMTEGCSANDGDQYIYVWYLDVPASSPIRQNATFTVDGYFSDVVDDIQIALVNVKNANIDLTPNYSCSSGYNDTPSGNVSSEFGDAVVGMTVLKDPSDSLTLSSLDGTERYSGTSTTSDVSVVSADGASFSTSMSWSASGTESWASAMVSVRQMDTAAIEVLDHSSNSIDGSNNSIGAAVTLPNNTFPGRALLVGVSYYAGSDSIDYVDVTGNGFDYNNEQLICSTSEGSLRSAIYLVKDPSTNPTVDVVFTTSVDSIHLDVTALARVNLDSTYDTSSCTSGTGSRNAVQNISSNTDTFLYGTVYYSDASDNITLQEGPNITEYTQNSNYTIGTDFVSGIKQGEPTQSSFGWYAAGGTASDWVVTTVVLNQYINEDTNTPMAYRIADGKGAFKVDASGNFYVAVNGNSNVAREFNLIKFNSSGIKQWRYTKSLEGGGINTIADVEVNSNGEVFLGAEMSDSGITKAYGIKLNPIGGEAYSYQLGTNDGGKVNDVMLDEANSYVFFCGATRTDTFSNYWDFMVQKYGTDDTGGIPGTYTYSSSFGDDVEECSSMALDDSGFVRAFGTVTTDTDELTLFAASFAESTMNISPNGYEDNFGSTLDSSFYSDFQLQSMMDKDSVMEDSTNADHYWVISYRPDTYAQIHKLDTVPNVGVSELTSDTYAGAGTTEAKFTGFKQYYDYEGDVAFAFSGFDIQGEQGFVGLVKQTNIGTTFPDEHYNVGTADTNVRVQSIAVSDDTAYVAGYYMDNATGADAYIGRVGWTITTITSTNQACLDGSSFALAEHRYMGGDSIAVDVREGDCGEMTPPTVGATTTEYDSAEVTSKTFSHTVATGTNRLLAVNITYNNNVTITDVSFGAQSLTLGCAAHTGEGRSSETWYLVAPTETTDDIVINWDGTMSGVAAGATNFTGVDQTTPISSSQCATQPVWTGDFGTYTDSYVTINSGAGQVVYGGISSYSDTINLTPQTGVTELWDSTNLAGNNIGAGGHMDGAAPSVVFGWDRSRDWPWAVSAISINGVSGAGGSIIADITFEYPNADFASLSLDGEVDGHKAWFDGTAAIAGTDWTLRIPKTGAHDAIRLCPNVTALAQVTSGCAGETSLGVSDPGVTDAGSYWTIDNLDAGTSYGAESYEEVPTVSVTEYSFHSYDSGDNDISVQVNAIDGHVIVASGNESGQIQISKVRVYDNQTIWTKTFSDPNSEISFFVTDVGIDTNENIYIGADAAITDTINNHDFFAAKFDFDGNVIWSKRYDGGSRLHDSFDPLTRMIVDGSGNVYLAGIMEVLIDNGTNWTQVQTVLKVDTANGNEIWRNVELDYGHSYANDLTVDASNNVFVCGGADVDTDTYHREQFVRKLDGNDGSEEWTYLSGTTNVVGALEQCTTIVYTNGNNTLVFGGSTKTTADDGTIDMNAVGIDPDDGSELWETIVANGEMPVGANYYFTDASYQTGANRVVMVGRTKYSAPTSASDAMIYAFAISNGSILWSDTYDNGALDRFGVVKAYTDFNGDIHYVTTGSTTISGELQAVTRSYNYNGTLEYTKLHDSGSFTSGRAIDIDSRGIVYVGAIKDTGDQNSLVLKYAYQVNNLNPALSVVADVGPQEVDLTTAGYGGQFMATLKNSDGIPVAQFEMGLLTDADWSTVEADKEGLKSFAHFGAGFTNTPGITGSTFSLLVPRTANAQSVYICPDATDLNGVDLGCSNGYAAQLTDPDVDLVMIGGQEYFRIGGLTGTGGLPINDASAVRDIMSRLEVNVPSNHNIEFGTTLGINSTGDTITLNFDDSFDFTAITVSDIDLLANAVQLTLCTGVLPCSAAAGTWGVSLNTGTNVLVFTAPTDAGSGTININDTINVFIGTNATNQAAGTNQPVNPATVGSYETALQISNGGIENGELEVPIIDDDTLNVRGYIDTFITFDIDTSELDENCDAAGGGNPCDSYGGATDNTGYVVSLGEMSTATVNTSGSTVKHADGNNGEVNSIWFDLSTNAAGGALVNVYSLNNGLQGPGGSIIDSVGAGEVQITAGSSLYGIQNRFLDTKSATGGSIVIHDDCDTDGGDTFYCSVGASVGRQLFNSNSGPVDQGRIQVRLGASPNALDATGTYTDELTFIAAPTF